MTPEKPAPTACRPEETQCTECRITLSMVRTQNNTSVYVRQTGMENLSAFFFGYREQKECPSGVTMKDKPLLVGGQLSKVVLHMVRRL